jgi:membrane protein
LGESLKGRPEQSSRAYQRDNHHDVRRLGKLAAVVWLAPEIPGPAGSTVSALSVAVIAASLYKLGPCRARARWRWVIPGALFFAAVWVALTLGFGFYVSHFGSYGATYGSLATIVVFLTWMYATSYAFLIGAELNSELEHQTARDSTTGPELPLGVRGAWMADHVAGARGQSDDETS